MNENLQNARNLLESGNYTCVVCPTQFLQIVAQICGIGLLDKADLQYLVHKRFIFNELKELALR